MISPRRAVVEMGAYNPPTSGRKDCLRLDFNENTVGCSQRVIAALRAVKRSQLSVYPEYAELRSKLAGYCNVRPEEIVATNGTDEAIKTVIEAYVERGKDEIIIPVPTYAMFKFYAQLNEAVIREISYNPNLSFPAKQVLGAISRRTKIVVLVNPNNPTGTSIPEKVILRIIEKAERYGALVFLDEAYSQFYGKTSVRLVRKYGNLFVSRTFSKAFGLAGLRLGFLVSDRNNIKVVQKVLSPYSVNIIAALCASAALKDSSGMRRYVYEAKKSRKLLCRELKSLGIPFFRSDANFILLKIGPQAGKFCSLLKERGILVRDRSSDRLLEGYVRVTLGTVRQTKALIRELKSVIKKVNPLLIFDIDGVLVDVSGSYRLAVKKTAEYFSNEKLSFSEIQEFKNRGGLNNDWDLTKAIISDRGVSVGRKNIVKRFQGFYRSVRKNEKQLIGVRVLDVLSKKYELAILTGRPRKEAFYALRNLKQYFSAVVCMEDVSRQKPNPEGILRLLKKFPGKNAYYFGDSVDDMKAAALAGAIPVGVLPPQDKSAFLRNLLLKNGAESVIRDINSVMEVLK